MESNQNHLPTKRWHERKTFASDTLKKINYRIYYYRKIIKTLNPKNEKEEKQLERIKNKFERDIKIRNLLNKAVKNLYKVTGLSGHRWY